MANRVTQKSGWGTQAALIQVVDGSGTANVVMGNVGAGINVQTGAGPLRVTYIGYRVDLAPDTTVGSVVSPVRWRLVVFTGSKFPDDLSSLQVQAYPTGSHPEIPSSAGPSASVPVLFDLYLDFSAGDPGLNALASIPFPDGGPTAQGNDALNIALVPMFDANLPTTPKANSNAFVTLIAFGTGIAQGQAGGQAGNQGTGKSIPRFDVSIGD